MPETRVRAAFFDVDDTVLAGKSMFAFQRYYLDVWRPAQAKGGASFGEFQRELARHDLDRDRAALNRAFYRGYAGHAPQDLEVAARAWFDALVAERGEHLWIPEAVALAKHLRAAGHLLVAVSGSCHEILAPVVAALGFDACLATRLARCDEGRQLSGEIVPPQMIGPGKALALAAFAHEHGIDLAASVACGDHLTDVPMLESVGAACVVAGDPALESLARRRGWPVLAGAVHDAQANLVHV